MLGAVSRATDWVQIESLFDPIMHLFPGRVGELNVEACKRGYEAVKMKEA
jgi:Pyruvate/2-oxoacid:ferredoxin oxidoreductase gamma subunit